MRASGGARPYLGSAPRPRAAPSHSAGSPHPARLASPRLNLTRRRVCVLVGGAPLAVVRCEPAIPDVQSLVDALNASNDFSAFVRHMRKRFQQLV